MTEQFRDKNTYPLPAFRLGTTQSVAYTSTHGVIASAVHATEPRLVIVHATTDCHIAVGAAPVATTSDKPVTGQVDFPLVVPPGQKVSAVQQTQGGTLYVTELL